MKLLPRCVVVGLVGLALVLAGLPPGALAQSPAPDTPTPEPAAARPADPATLSLGPEITQMLAVLENKDVYVSPAMAAQVSPAEQQDLEALVADLNNRGYPIRIIVLSGIPPDVFRSLGEFTDELHAYLGLDKGILIVATQTGVSAQSRRLDKEEMQELTDRSSQIFKNSGYAPGLRGLAQSMIDAIQAKQANNARWALMIFFGLLLLLILGLVVFLLMRRNRWQRAIALARQEHHRLQAAAELIAPELEQLPRGQWASEAQRVFEPVNAELEELGKQVDAVGRASLGQIIFRSGDWELVLKDALAGLHDIRSGLKRTQELAAQASPTFRPVPLPVPIHPVSVSSSGGISADELQARLAAYGGPPTACFFCAQPLQANLAAQVEANLGGRWRQLLACQHHANEVNGGAEPMVRSIETEEGHVPWFADRNFVPYRDYDPQYTRGIALDDLEGYLFAIETAPVVVTTEDARWVEFQAETGGGGAEPPMFTPDTADASEYAPPAAPTEGTFTYAEPTVYRPSGSATPDATGSTGFPLLPETAQSDAGWGGVPGVDSLAPDLRAAFERAVREAEQGPGATEPVEAGDAIVPEGAAGAAPEPTAFHPDYGVAPGAVRPTWPELPNTGEDVGTALLGETGPWAIPTASAGTWTVPGEEVESAPAPADRAPAPAAETISSWSTVPEAPAGSDATIIAQTPVPFEVARSTLPPEEDDQVAPGASAALAWPGLAEALSVTDDPWQTPTNGFASDGRAHGPAWAEPSGVSGSAADHPGDVVAPGWGAPLDAPPTDPEPQHPEWGPVDIWSLPRSPEPLQPAWPTPPEEADPDPWRAATRPDSEPTQVGDTSPPLSATGRSADETWPEVVPPEPDLPPAPAPSAARPAADAGRATPDLPPTEIGAEESAAPATGEMGWELPATGLTLNWDALEEDDEPRRPVPGMTPSAAPSGSRPARRPPPPPVITDPAALGARPAAPPPAPPADPAVPAAPAEESDAGPAAMAGPPPATAPPEGEEADSVILPHPAVPPRPATSPARHQPVIPDAPGAEAEDPGPRRIRRALGRGLGPRRDLKPE